MPIAPSADRHKHYGSKVCPRQVKVRVMFLLSALTERLYNITGGLLTGRWDQSSCRYAAFIPPSPPLMYISVFMSCGEINFYSIKFNNVERSLYGIEQKKDPRSSLRL